MVLLHPDIAANFEFYRAAQAAGTALEVKSTQSTCEVPPTSSVPVSALAGEPRAGLRAAESR